MKFDGVEVRPLKRMFVDGRMVGPDDKVKTFRFTGDELPAHCLLANEVVPPEAPKRKMAETKPDDAVAAVKAKAAGASLSE